MQSDSHAADKPGEGAAVLLVLRDVLLLGSLSHHFIPVGGHLIAPGSLVRPFEPRVLAHVLETLTPVFAIPMDVRVLEVQVVVGPQARQEVSLEDQVSDLHLRLRTSVSILGVFLPGHVLVSGSVVVHLVQDIAGLELVLDVVVPLGRGALARELRFDGLRRFEAKLIGHMVLDVLPVKLFALVSVLGWACDSEREGALRSLDQLRHERLHQNIAEWLLAVFEV